MAVRSRSRLGPIPLYRRLWDAVHQLNVFNREALKFRQGPHGWETLDDSHEAARALLSLLAGVRLTLARIESLTGYLDLGPQTVVHIPDAVSDLTKVLDRVSKLVKVICESIEAQELQEPRVVVARQLSTGGSDDEPG